MTWAGQKQQIILANAIVHQPSGISLHAPSRWLWNPAADIFRVRKCSENRETNQCGHLGVGGWWIDGTGYFIPNRASGCVSHGQIIRQHNKSKRWWAQQTRKKQIYRTTSSLNALIAHRLDIIAVSKHKKMHMLTGCGFVNSILFLLWCFASSVAAGTMFPGTSLRAESSVHQTSQEASS